MGCPRFFLIRGRKHFSSCSRLFHQNSLRKNQKKKIFPYSYPPPCSFKKAKNFPAGGLVNFAPRVGRLSSIRSGESQICEGTLGSVTRPLYITGATLSRATPPLHCGCQQTRLAGLSWWCTPSWQKTPHSRAFILLTLTQFSDKRHSRGCRAM